MKRVTRSAWIFLVSVLASATAQAGSVPPCLDWGKQLPVMNAQVVAWKSSTPNQFLARARVSGVVGKIYPDHSGHHHFQMILGNGPGQTLEVIFNQDFGIVPTLHTGMTIEACGDYITSTAGPYPVSPDGAIIHWVHATNHPEKHPGGYLLIDGQLYGQDLTNAYKYEDAYRLAE